MMQIKSLSEKRLLMRVKVNGDDAVMMLDTAASVGILDSRQRKRYKLIERVTGERILGIMSLSQMTAANMRIDFNDNLIVFE